MKKLQEYTNGNYKVEIYNDGTKVKTTQDDTFVSEFPESIDMKLTNYCTKGCAYCHEQSTTQGQHADIMSYKFIDNLRAGTEIACGGGMVSSHPDFEQFAKKLTKQGVIVNATFHQDEFMENIDMIDRMVQEGNLKGIGVSYVMLDKKWLETVKKYPNAVIHLIAGVHFLEDFIYLSNHGLKILILGYKTYGRGKKLYSYFGDAITNKIERLKEKLLILLPKFKVVSFDNLAIEQLDIKNKITKEQWQEFYQGDDGTHTMYVDLVTGLGSRSSTHRELTYDVKTINKIDEIFQKIREEKIGV